MDSITDADAKDIIRAVSEALAKLLNAHIIDVLWKQEGQGGVILNPFVSFDTTPRKGAKQYQIRDDAADNPTGVWIWVYKNSQPLWIEKIRSRDKRESARNEATGDEIDPQYLNFLETTDSIMAIPLVCRGMVWGIYSIEFPESGKLNEDISELLKRISGAFATIIWKADLQKFNQEQRSEAVRRFCASWQDYKVENLLASYRRGLVIRPFDSKFNLLEECTKRFFKKYDIHAEHFRYETGEIAYVIDDIMQKINSSHFGIADVTGCNLNVMCELGMMMVLQKKVILLRRNDDDTAIPFDISNYHCYVYEERPGSEIMGTRPWNEALRTC